MGLLTSCWQGVKESKRKRRVQYCWELYQGYYKVDIPSLLTPMRARGGWDFRVVKFLVL